jgi:hypothetical protein
MSDVPKWQKDLLKGEIKEPRMREVGAHFIDIVGGPRKFAQMLKSDYDESDAGSLNRSRIMGLIVQTLKTGGDDNSDLSGLTEDDLRREVEELVGGKRAETTEAADPVRGGGSDAPSNGAAG